MASVYGKRLMPTVVDEIAQKTPRLTYAFVPLSANISDGFNAVTFSDIASATNYLAAWIDRTLGCSSNFDTIAYMGPGDLRYVVVFLAAVKCGYKVLLPSARNSPWMNASLLEQTGCKHLLFAPEVDPFVKPVLSQKPDLNIHVVEPLQDLIKPDTVHYPFDKQYESAKWDPILVLHSSGSTGPPRPIIMNHNTFAVGDNDRNLPTVPGRINQNWSLWDFPEKETFFSPFPAFHLAGFSSMVMLPIYYSNATLVLPPASRPPSGHLVSEIMDHFKLKSIFCPPIIAEQLIEEPSGLEKCKALKFLMSAGGPLSQAAGEAISQVTHVCQLYGQTETGPMQVLVPRREDWASLEWHPKQEAIMDPSVDGTYELIMKRNPALEGIRGLSCNFPDVEVWHTKDLFKPHPSKPGLWKFHGRVDDIIVLSNGEKFNPVPAETHIASHPLLSGALIIGQGYPQASLVLECKTHDKEAADVIEQVWPTVEKANRQSPTHGRITKDMIIVATPEKPFDRAGKGTVIRRSSGSKYEKEISELHTRDISKSLQHVSLDALPDSAAITRFVTEVVNTAFPGRTLSYEDDFFVSGLDSLQTAEIISLLKAGLRATKAEDFSWITAKFVYDHPTISSLSSAVFKHVRPTHSDSGTNQTSHPSRLEKMERLIEKYTQNLPPPKERSSSTDFHVLLTGSTGSLGVQMLAQLLMDPKISRISCLDRSKDARERINGSFSSWSSPPSLDHKPVSFYQADYSREDLGLDTQIFSDLQSSVNAIVHNAWKVDFNHSLASFEPVHIRGVRNFIQFAASSSIGPRIVFISSISSMGNWINTISEEETAKLNARAVPEIIPSTPITAQSIGYAESKAVAEHILANAAETCGIPVSIVRVGQIAGPINPTNGGRWNEHEWFPLLLKTSKALGKLPLLDPIDWVPMDVLASAVLDLSTLPTSLPPYPSSLHAQVFHLVNPTSVPWEKLLPAIQNRLGVRETVSMHDWVQELEKVDLEDDNAVVKSPAVKILDFFRNMATGGFFGATDVEFSTVATREASPALKGLEPVKEEWVEKWMSDWGY